MKIAPAATVVMMMKGILISGVIFRGSEATGFPPIVVNFFPSSR